MTLNDTFQTIYYINLDARVDRKAHIEKQLSDNGIVAQRFPAVDAKAEMISGVRACQESHKKAIEQSTGNVFIFEDDAVLSKFYKDEIGQILSDLPPVWDFFFLGANHRSKPIHYKGNLQQAKEPYCTHAYGISEKFKPILLKWIEQNENAIDALYAWLTESGKCWAYCAYPILAWQMPNHSNIEGREMDYSFMVPERELL